MTIPSPNRGGMGVLAAIPEDYLIFVMRILDAGDVPDYTPDDRELTRVESS